MYCKNIILIHGLYMSPAAMRILGGRLAAHGFIPHYFGYPTVRLPLGESALNLAAFIRQNRLFPCSFVAHSLGGLLLRRLAAAEPGLLAGRAVTLGTPHRGSRTAARLHRLYPPLIGGAWDNALDGRLPAEPLPVACGNIAGTSGRGMGRLLAALPEPHDGTVSLDETVLPGSISLTLPCGHTGLLFDPAAAAHTAHFLQYGTFDGSGR